MIDFLIKSAIGLIVFLGFYHLILEREKMHRFNRFFLLFSIMISIVIPFISFEIIKEIPEQIGVNERIENDFSTTEIINYELILWILYGIITFILTIRFGRNIQNIISKIKENSIVAFKNSKLVLVEEKILPHTFLNYIFINSEEYQNKKIESELFTHELVHVSQKHTLDILFIEVLKTVFWFNPIFIFYKKAIQLNHEFLADQEIVKTYDNVPFYQNLLLSKGNRNQAIYLASNLNYSVTKKRLTMMKKTTSRNIAFTKKFAVLPVLVILMAFLCIKTVAQEVMKNAKSENKNVSDTEKKYSNATEVLINADKKVLIKKKPDELPKQKKTSASDTVKTASVSSEKKSPFAKKYVGHPLNYSLTGNERAFDDAKQPSSEKLSFMADEETLEKKKEYKKSVGFRKMDFDTTMFRKPTQH